jgi:hypothetical protein
MKQISAKFDKKRTLENLIGKFFQKYSSFEVLSRRGEDLGEVS